MANQPPRKSKGLAVAIAGLVALGVVAGGTVVWVLISTGILGGADAGPDGTRLAVTQAASPEPTADHTVTFEVLSRDGASSLGSVTYSAENAEGLLLHEPESSVELPFQKTVELDDPLPSLTMWAFNRGADSVLICRIRVDGTLVVEKSSSGYFNSAFCQVPAK
ncbi:MmpS family transport accessory protein [Microbispora bryophytorum]|uniref:MmpS family transport accessory protein n=1 Tax=Microbispora bryophytorum TaxID=1460882 RepID=UPI0033E8CDA7